MPRLVPLPQEVSTRQQELMKMALGGGLDRDLPAVGTHHHRLSWLGCRQKAQASVKNPMKTDETGIGGR